MFTDYYSILGVDTNATQEDITIAYRKQSLKWHPDKNPNRDTTREMQDINEAYHILRDSEKRARYDLELRRYYEFCGIRKQKNEQGSTQKEYSYTIHNDKVKDDIRDAKTHAKSFVENLQKTSRNAINGAWEECKIYVYIAIIMTILSPLMMTCV